VSRDRSSDEQKPPGQFGGLFADEKRAGSEIKVVTADATVGEIVESELLSRRLAIRDRTAKRRHYVLVISGILSNGDWVGRLRKSEHFQQDEVVFIPIQTKMSGITRLVFRYGVKGLQSSIRNQIFNELLKISKNDPRAFVSIFAHSLGTDLVSDAIQPIQYQFHSIFFLGSICRTTKAENIRQKCTHMYNDKGAHDRYSLIAGLLLPYYEASGVFGFRSNFAEQDCFDRDHYDCAEEQHVVQAIMPRLLSQSLPKEHLADSYYSYPRFCFFRNVVGLALAVGILTLITSALLPLPSFITWSAAAALGIAVAVVAAYFVV
jgi:hypothetical protein